jgi:hypothetical protein
VLLVLLFGAEEAEEDGGEDDCGCVGDDCVLSVVEFLGGVGGEIDSAFRFVVVVVLEEGGLFVDVCVFIGIFDDGDDDDDVVSVIIVSSRCFVLKIWGFCWTGKEEFGESLGGCNKSQKDVII